MTSTQSSSGMVPNPMPHPHIRHPEAGETTLFLVRHGQTEANVKRLLLGATDVPLDTLGFQQAASVAGRLAELGPFDALISSSLSRALSTAKIIGERVNLKPITSVDLGEINFGEVEGKTFEEVLDQFPDLAEQLLDLSNFDVRWPGGESRGGFYERVINAFDRILRNYASHRVIVVAHGGVIGAFLAMVQGRSLNDPTIYDVVNCSLSHLHITPDHTVLHLRNDVCHLESAMS